MSDPISTKTNTATLRGLLPDWDYATSVSANGGVNWSPTLVFRTISDKSAPAAPSNLKVQVVGSSFVLTWDAPTTNEDGTELSDFNDYVIRTYPTGTPTAAVEETTRSTTYEFSIYQNRHFFGTPQGALTFEVMSRDLTMNRSAAATINAATAPPVAFTIYINTGPRAIEVYWNNQGVTTFYKVYRGTAPGFAPDDATNLLGSIVSEAGDDTRLSYWDIPPTTDTYYYKVVAYDAFNNTAQSSNEVSGAAEEAGGGLDTTPLNTPAAPTVTGGVHSFTVQHNMLDSAGAALGSNLSRFDVYASTTTGFTPDAASFVGSIAVSSSTVAEETFVWVVKSTTTSGGSTVSGTDTVYVKVVAVNIAGGATAASAQASGTVDGAGSPYFKALAIGDGHIANLSANKLKANTAIANNLTVSALLKMGTGGTIESGNYAVDATTGAQTGGWRLTDTQFSIVGATRINGTIEATAGWLQNLRVYSNLTVGSSTTAGAIQSYNYAAGSTGWKVASAGDAEFNNVTVRGYVGANSGYLSNLSISGVLSISGSGKISVNADRVRIDQYGITAFDGSKNTFRIDQNGVATFAGGLSAATGTFAGNLSAAGGTFRGVVEATEYKSAGATYSFSLSSNQIIFKYGTSATGRIYWGSTGALYFDALYGMAASAYIKGDNVIIQSAQGLLLESSGNASCTFKVGLGNSTSLKHTYSTNGTTANNATASIMTSHNYNLWAAPLSHNHSYASKGTYTTTGPSTSNTGNAAPSTNNDTWSSNTSGTVQGYTYSGGGHVHGLPYHSHSTPNHYHSISHSHTVTI